jgi:hypothetical protein
MTAYTVMAQKFVMSRLIAKLELRQALMTALTAQLIIVTKQMMLLLTPLTIACALMACGAMALSLVMEHLAACLAHLLIVMMALIALLTPAARV